MIAGSVLIVAKFCKTLQNRANSCARNKLCKTAQQRVDVKKMRVQAGGCVEECCGKCGSGMSVSSQHGNDE